MPYLEVFKHTQHLRVECFVFAREAIAWYGPFVMNTKQEILDAMDDFEAGRMGAIAPEHA